MSMNLITRKIFETPNRNLAERTKNLRSVVEAYGHRLLLLKCTRTEKTKNEMSKKNGRHLKAANWSMSQTSERTFEISTTN